MFRPRPAPSYPSRFYLEKARCLPGDEEVLHPCEQCGDEPANGPDKLCSGCRPPAPEEDG